MLVNSSASINAETVFFNNLLSPFNSSRKAIQTINTYGTLFIVLEVKMKGVKNKIHFGYARILFNRFSRKSPHISTIKMNGTPYIQSYSAIAVRVTLRFHPCVKLMPSHHPARNQ